MAEMGGFKQPILHGLLSYGFTARALYETVCNKDANLLKKFAARFTSHIFPGETYVVQIWKNGDNIIFQTKCKERDTVVLKGFAELREPAKL